MSVKQGDSNDGVAAGASRLLMRGAADDVRAARRLAAMIGDVLLDDDARLDEQTRTLVLRRLAALVTLVERDVRHFAGRLLVARALPEMALPLAGEGAVVLDRLVAADLLRDTELMRVVIGQCAEAMLAARLPGPVDDAGAPGLLLRLADDADGVIAAAAQALLAAAARRDAAMEGAAARGDLPAECQHRLVWLAAAVLREAFAPAAPGAALAELDRALTEAAERALAAHDEGERAEAAAMRLAAAIDARRDELPLLLVEALADRRPALFTALIARALGIDYEAVRTMLLDPDADRLWIALRSLRVDRAAIARIGLALCDADPRRDVEAFADRLDSIVAMPAADASEALRALQLHPDLRAALAAIERAR